MEHEIACCREERMKNGKEYCHSIHQQISDLLQKAYLGDNERMILDKLGFGKMRFVLSEFYFSFFMLLETLSPDLLDAYDAEFERILQLYEKRKPVIDAYEKWLSFWNDFVSFTVGF